MKKYVKPTAELIELEGEKFSFIEEPKDRVETVELPYLTLESGLKEFEKVLKRTKTE